MSYEAFDISTRLTLLRFAREETRGCRRTGTQTPETRKQSLHHNHHHHHHRCGEKLPYEKYSD
jgi:hypothetical protein